MRHLIHSLFLLRVCPHGNHVLHRFGWSSTWKSTFLKTGLRGKNWKTLPLCSCLDGESTIFVFWWRHRSTPWPLAFVLLTLRSLITTATMTADYMLVFVLQKILSLSGSLRQNIQLLCQYAEQKKDYGWPTSHFRLFRASFTHMPRLFFSIFDELQAPPISLEYEPQRVESFTMDPFGCKYSWNDAEKNGEKRSFWYVWTWPIYGLLDIQK